MALGVGAGVTTRAGAGLALSLVTATLAGCGAAPAATAPSSAPAPSPAPTCASAAGVAGPEWPRGVPATIPRIPTAVIGSVTQIQSITYVRFTTSQSLREGLIYLVRALRDAGFVLGRGDAEAAEADAPFSSLTTLGSVRLAILTRCSTSWLLAVTPKNIAGAPAVPLIPFKPGPGASPLPFA